MSHSGLGQSFHRLSETATHRLGQEVFRDVPLQALWARRAEALDSLRERVRCIRCRCRFGPVDDLTETIVTRTVPCVIAALVLGLSACTNPYDPVQRGLGGGVIGAASGAAIGAAAGGGPGAALGAAIGGATGIVGGVATTPPPPPGTYYGYPPYGYPAYPSPSYGYPGYSGYPAYSGPSGYGYQGYSAQPPYPGPPAYGSPSNLGYPGYTEPPTYGYQSRALGSPAPDFGNESPGYGFPDDRPSEDGSPGALYGIEPSS